MDTEELPSGNGIVQIAYLHGEEVSYSWRDSMRRMAEHDRAQQALAPRDLEIMCGSGVLIPKLRNYAVQLFLDHTEHEWLMFVDTDMGFEADAVHKLLASADPSDRPIVGGLCFAVLKATRDGVGGWRQAIVPTMYKLGDRNTDGKGSFCHYGPYEYDAMVPVAATGAAFLLIHRSVLNLMRSKLGDHWFSMVTDDVGDLIGEDIAFCLRAGSLGVPMHVNTAVKTTHHKSTWVGEQDYFAVMGQDKAEVETYPNELPVFIDLAASFKALANNEHDRDDMLKLPADLERYEAIIAADRPEVIIETGTFKGGSAHWFAERGVTVITIDVNEMPWPQSFLNHDSGAIYGLTGSSVDPVIAKKAKDLVQNRRVMVVLDSDHSAGHVGREIELYGPLVTPGCHLVVEDGIFGYGTSGLRDQHFPAGLDGSPLDPIVGLLVGSDDWSRDVAIEKMSPVSSNPAGYWVRNG